MFWAGLRHVADKSETKKVGTWSPTKKVANMSLPKFHYIYLAQNLLKTRSPTCRRQVLAKPLRDVDEDTFNWLQTQAKSALAKWKLPGHVTSHPTSLLQVVSLLADERDARNRCLYTERRRCPVRRYQVFPQNQWRRYTRARPVKWPGWKIHLPG